MLALLALLLPAASAEAAYPGKNGYIAFLGYTYDGTSDIYIGNETGTGRLTNSGSESEPKWSPDGTRIAFVSERDGNKNIYVMNADGSGQTRLTATPQDERWPTWSPDGKKIAFADLQNGDVVTMSPDGSNQTVVIDRGPNEVYDLSWSPKGDKFLFSQRVTNLDGTGEVYLDSAYWHDPASCYEQKWDYSFRWSPNGEKIVFVHYEDEGENEGPGCHGAFWYELHTINPDGTGEQHLWPSDSGYLEYGTAWSPDGQKVAFSDTFIGWIDVASRTREGYFLTYPVMGADPDWQPIPVNKPPDCSGVTASVGGLWPPNHQFRSVSLGGATDPDGQAVTLEVDGVTQDELVGGKPDAQNGTSADAVQLRADRDPHGDGRVYRIAFTVSDGTAQCSGSATVEVRRHKYRPALDSAPPGYDSFGP
jgi:dipeptidyl aminopeptidase/acylaminoacyl peptidase